MSAVPVETLPSDTVLADTAPVETTPVETVPVETVPADKRHGRGVVSNQSGRFEHQTRHEFDDGWDELEALEPLQTSVQLEPARTIISRNTSPDVPFLASINPYRGCEHGCSYCYARPTHCFLGHSAGLDFETRLYAKPNAAALLEQELAKPRYKPQTIVIGANTDPYQPIERDYKITRALLEVFERTSHPVGIITKSALVTRDIDILSVLARRKLIKVVLSITTLDRVLARKMEPRASTPARRIEALQQLHDAGIPTGVLIAPIIPALNEPELETIMSAAKDAGVSEVGYVLLRLPLEVKELFAQWLEEAYPDKARHVMGLMRQMHGGKAYDADYTTRRRGTGPLADLLAARFQLARKRLKLDQRQVELRSDLFCPPTAPGGQMTLF